MRCCAPDRLSFGAAPRPQVGEITIPAAPRYQQDDAPMVIDTHTHCWGPPSVEHPWMNAALVDRIDTFDVGTMYTVSDLRADMERLDVSAAVVVSYPIYRWTDNWYTLEAVAPYEDLSGIVTIDPFTDGSAVHLRELMEHDGVVGFRLAPICSYDDMWRTFNPDAGWLREAVELDDFWMAARDTGAIVQLLAHETQLDQVRTLVKSYPDLPYLLDHFLETDTSVPLLESPFADLGSLATYEQVRIKLSAAPHRSGEEFPYSDLNEYVRWLLERYGRERLVWGSDYPNVSDVTSYEESLTWLRAVDGLSTTDYEWITGKSFRRLLGE